MMRIITGKAKGIKLDTLSGDNTRPTAERVKEAVFSMLQFDIEGRRVLDLFAGSGQMGLESISRGASEAVFVERSKDAVKVIEKNIAKTRLSSYCKVITCDCMDFINRNRSDRYDIIFLDPPYASGLYIPVLKALFANSCLKPSTMIVCESDFDELLEKEPELKNIYRIMKTSRYGKTVITVLEVVNEE